MLRFPLLAQAATVLALVVGAAAAQAADWHPLKVQVGAADKAALADYSPLAKASKSWSICVSFPHLKDPLFVAVNYGMIEEAKRLGARVQTLDAGGYTGLNTQISQIENCVAGGADAVVMVAVARDGMNNLLAQLKAKNIPVIDAINGVSSRDTAARVLTSPRDEGLRAGQYLARKHPAGSKAVKVGWLPGPSGAGFVEAFNSGFLEGIKGSAVVIAETKNGDVGKEVQARLVEDMLQTHKDLDYVVGTAVMAEAAVPLLKARKLQDKVKLVSVYMTPGVYANVKARNIEAAGATPIPVLGRVMLDTAVRVLENKLEYADVNLLGQVWTSADIGKLEASSVLAPASFRPVFKFGK
ncbi:MAG TPA: TMAO reductase system periplasmic protein TorT [Ramlibacter sp.]|nr:TMAO reductase system periplasmic protein TorT [Ramlibacter sp.]